MCAILSELQSNISAMISIIVTNIYNTFHISIPSLSLSLSLSVYTIVWYQLLYVLCRHCMFRSKAHQWSCLSFTHSLSHLAIHSVSGVFISGQNVKLLQFLPQMSSSCNNELLMFQIAGSFVCWSFRIFFRLSFRYSLFANCFAPMISLPLSEYIRKTGKDKGILTIRAVYKGCPRSRQNPLGERL